MYVVVKAQFKENCENVIVEKSTWKIALFRKDNGEIIFKSISKIELKLYIIC